MVVGAIAAGGLGEGVGGRRVAEVALLAVVSVGDLLRL